MRQCFRSLLMITVLVLPLPSAVRADQGGSEDELRLDGALAYVESFAMRRIVEAIRVDAPAEAALGLQPGAGPGVWTLSGTAEVVDFSGRSGEYPYRVSLASRCEAYDQSRCWDLRSLSIGQWNLSDETPTVAGLASLGPSGGVVKPVASAKPEPEVEPAVEAAMDGEDPSYLSPDPTKVFEEIRLARRMRDDGRDDGGEALPVVPDVPLPPASDPASEPATASATDRQRQDDPSNEVPAASRTPTPEELALAIKTYRASQGGTATNPPVAGAAGGNGTDSVAAPPAQVRTGASAGTQLADHDAEGADWLHDRSRQGDPRAQFELAERYRTGHGVAQDYGKAVALYRQAADLGSIDAQYQLAVMYVEGEGLAKNPARAVPLFRAAAVKGHAVAQYRLARIYEKGEVVAADAAIAVEWYRLSARQGNAWAQLALGNHYRIGKGIERDLTRSIVWYRRAAKQGNSWAQYELGNGYRYGKGVRRDAARAQGWLQLAADAGNSAAKFALSSMLSKGEAVEGKSMTLAALMAGEPETDIAEPAQPAAAEEEGAETQVALATEEATDVQASASPTTAAEWPAMSERQPPLPPKPAPRTELAGWDEGESELAVVAPTALPEVVAAGPEEESGASTDVAELPEPESQPVLEGAEIAPTPEAANITLMQAIATSEETVGQVAAQEAAYVTGPESANPRVEPSLEPNLLRTLSEPQADPGSAGQSEVRQASPVAEPSQASPAPAETEAAETLPSGAVLAERAPAEPPAVSTTAVSAAAEGDSGSISSPPGRLTLRPTPVVGDYPQLDESLAFLTGAMDPAADPIGLLLERAERQMAKLALTTPRGASAYDTYQEILDLSPGHPQAVEGIRQIGVQYVKLAERALERGARSKAQVYIAKAQKLAPDHPEVLALETAWAAFVRENREVSSPTSLLRNTKMLSVGAARAFGQEAAARTGPVAEAAAGAESGTGPTELGGAAPLGLTAGPTEPVGKDSAPAELALSGESEVIMRGMFYAQAGLEAQQQGELERAIEYYKMAIGAGDLSDKSLAYLYNNLGANYRTMGAYDRAIENYDAAIRLRPRYAAAFFNRGIAYDQQGLDIQALEDYDTAIRLRPDLSGAYNHRGLAYVKAGRYDLAIEDFSEAIRLDPDLDAAYFNRAQAYHLKGDRERALQDIEKSYSMNPDNLDYQGKMREFGLL